MTADIQPTERHALDCDAADPLRAYRGLFSIPRARDGSDVVYLAGNSLGLQPKGVRQAMELELDQWAEKAVDAHFSGGIPWYSYHEALRDSAARLVGARTDEVVVMNSLTVNLHLMMVSFFHPTRDRFKILMEYPAFPSDTYAVKTHLRTRGLDPGEALVVARPRDGEHTLRFEDIERVLDEQGGRIAMVMFGGVNFFTGQAFDMERITAAAHRLGCVMGWDLAHAAGNVPLRLHDWGVDFAVWCSYKYLNSGPGAVAGCFVHERHAAQIDLPRFGGWWGNDPDTRFLMHLQPEFIPRSTADGWQLSNPPILAMAPVKVSLDMFDRAGMDALRHKSVLLTGYLSSLIDRLPSERVEIITPQEPDGRGCQLSILAHDRPKELHGHLQTERVVCDFREPNVIRVAPTPLYNTFHDVWRFAHVLSRHVTAD
jgi:kynureninase